MTTQSTVTFERTSPQVATITFANPPFNLVVAESVVRLTEIVAQLATDPEIQVLVFESGVPDFFINHSTWRLPPTFRRRRTLMGYPCGEGASRIIDFLKSALDADAYLTVPNPDSSVLMMFDAQADWAQKCAARKSRSAEMRGRAARAA